MPPAPTSGKDARPPVIPSATEILGGSSASPTDSDSIGDGSSVLPSSANLASNPHAAAAHMHNGKARVYTFPSPRMAPQAAGPGPEKCLTWCSQRNDAPALCRMLCLRRRAALPTQSEALARLRPQTVNSDGSYVPAPARPPATSNGSAKEPEPLSFFESMRARLAPYSLIYVKGSPEGVVGRYMEELDGDDGIYDFGPVSRHAPLSLRRKSTNNIEWLDWEDAGYLLHVPFTSLFSPILNLPANLERVLGPPFRLVDRYTSSFTDGTQTRAMNRLAEEIKRGGAIDMVTQIGSFYQRKHEQRLEHDREARERHDEAMRAAKEGKGGGAREAASRAADVNKEREGKGE